MSKIIVTLIVVLALTGCWSEHIPSQTFILDTVDGKRIHLVCPVVDQARSSFTYIIDRNCTVEPPVVILEDKP